MKNVRNIVFAVSVLFVTLAWANPSSDVWAKGVNDHEDIVVETGEIIPGSYARFGNHTMSVPETEETMLFRFRKSSVSSADPPANASTVDFGNNSGLNAQPPMALYYGLASTFTLEGNSLMVTLQERTGVFLQASPIATQGKIVVARARFRTNSLNASIALGLLTGVWGDSDGSNQHVIYTNGSGFADWREVTVSFSSDKQFVTPFLQVASNNNIPSAAVGSNGVQVMDWVVYREGDSPPEPQPDPQPESGNLSTSGFVLTISDSAEIFEDASLSGVPVLTDENWMLIASGLKHEGQLTFDFSNWTPGRHYLLPGLREGNESIYDINWLVRENLSQSEQGLFTPVDEDEFLIVNVFNDKIVLGN